MSKVAIVEVKDGNVEFAVREAIRLIGGLKQFIDNDLVVTDEIFGDIYYYAKLP